MQARTFLLMEITNDWYYSKPFSYIVLSIVSAKQSFMIKRVMKLR
jgi:hypothetical protein